MKIANIAEFKNKLSEYLALVDQGEEIEIRRYNVPIARVVPILGFEKNKTVLGCGKGTVKIKGSLTEPLIPQEDWHMLSNEQGM